MIPGMLRICHNPSKSLENTDDSDTVEPFIDDILVRDFCNN